MTPQTQILLEQAANALTRNALGEAESVSRKALQLDNTCHQANFFLAQVESKRGNRVQSEEYVRMALDLDPENPQYQMALAATLFANSRLNEGVELLERALSRQPENFVAHHHLATGLASLGRLDDAVAHYQTAIRLKPTFSAAHYQLASLKHFAENDDQLAQLREMVKHQENFPPREYSQLCFALAKGLEQTQKFDEAFDYYVKGNESRKHYVTFDLSAQERALSEISKTFGADFFANKATPLTTNIRPILIVGMPRSGSTLVEQILSNHPKVQGLGELPFLPDLIGNTMGELPYPESVESIPWDKWRSVVQQYINLLRSKADGWDRVTDKQLFNFKHLWLVFRYLPKARVIYCRRNIMDTCWSCYTTAFKNDLGFSNDLETTAKTYQAIELLMDHWITLFPNRIHVVDYEDLVQDVQSQSRDLVQFAEEPWSDQCLEFHINPRQVTTSSVAQVRKPIYKSSVGRWRRFRRQLAPLKHYTRT